MENRYRSLDLEQQGPILRVWLNRPKRLNAISPTVLREIGDVFLALETDFDTKVVVLGGRGRAFCAGADRKPPLQGDDVPAPRSDRERRWLDQLGRRACRAIEDCDAVTIARVQGHAVGGGCCFAMACDFLASARSFCSSDIQLSSIAPDASALLSPFATPVSMSCTAAAMVPM